MTSTIELTPMTRSFVPLDRTIDSWESAEEFYQDLVKRPLESSEAMMQWLDDWSELRSILDEDGSRRSVRTSCNTADEEAKDAYLDYVRTIAPKIEEWDNKLERKYYDSPFREAVRSGDLKRLDQIFAAHIELFDERNIPIQVEADELVHQYSELTGKWTVKFEGDEYTLPQMAKFLHDQDRDLRCRAMAATAEVRLADRDKLDENYDALLERRGRIAANVGLSDYREFMFRGMLRDYTPDDCHRFHDAIEQCAVPRLKKIYEGRRRRLGLDRLGPFDLQVDPEGKPPLKPFDQVPVLLEKTSGLFHEIDARFGVRFDAVTEYMDLESRKGKAPGAFQATFRASRHPFIFANLVGYHRDLSTLVHESGHAFHAIQSRAQKLFWLDQSGMEFAEVSSMSQELMMLDGLGRFYPDPEDRKRAAREQWESTVNIFCWVAVIDGLQHWIYTHPDHTREERRERFVDLYGRFMPVIDWGEMPDGTLANYWQRQLHLYYVPFYYIEYALAELGALQVYRNYKKDPEKAAERLLAAQTLGGSRGAPELFEAAGCRFDLGPELLDELMQMVEGELDALDS